MSNKQWKKWVSVVGRMLLAYALVFAQGAWAAQDQGTKDKAASQQKVAAQQANEKQPSVATSAKAQSKQAQGEESESAVAEEKPSRDGSHEGIKVHGHWTIEVRNPDGTLVTHREFENSLTQSTGAPLLANLLNSVGGPSVPASLGSFWAVDLGGSACFTQNLAGAGTLSPPGDCTIIQGSSAPVALQAALNSGIFVPFINAIKLATSVSGGSFVLSGTVQATDSSSINSVAAETFFFSISPTLPPTSSLTANQFTSRPLDGLNGDPQPVPVSAGQTIAVTVKISFS